MKKIVLTALVIGSSIYHSASRAFAPAPGAIAEFMAVMIFAAGGVAGLIAADTRSRTNHLAHVGTQSPVAKENAPVVPVITSAVASAILNKNVVIALVAAAGVITVASVGAALYIREMVRYQTEEFRHACELTNRKSKTGQST